MAQREQGIAGIVSIWRQSSMTASATTMYASVYAVLLFLCCFSLLVVHFFLISVDTDKLFVAVLYPSTVTDK